MRVGFIGLGRMGQGMAQRVLGAGHELSVFDLFATQTAPLAAAGAEVATSVIAPMPTVWWFRPVSNA